MGELSLFFVVLCDDLEYNTSIGGFMEDLFCAFEDYKKEYLIRQYNYDMSILYYFETIEGWFRNLVAMKKGNDLICLDYMEFNEYTKMVARQFNIIVRNYQSYLGDLEKDIVTPEHDYRTICDKVSFCGMISCDYLLELFRCLGIIYKDVCIHKNEEGMTVSILDNGEYVSYSFFGERFMINMLEVKDDEIVFDSKLEYLLGTDFIRFFVNNSYNKGSNDIEVICDEYKKSCLIR